ncbi:Glycerophosphodiester phosphodiesterase 1 [Hondaea fermentalgiana]|uniref:Glycerophosphodiester phosphodiesterase 1 n=1 Tax=Hondaea fermentalgiana TaxID=2315210 RepID=A0A2R5GMF1_9STRA|nr:Glycerophosphodiester phosphodiesterase 1 [Hondaea fermentalgiana]|eukprot:GBG32072.1 Glycerophosphodiester phosphodiesterase 1 [Hondaea fermentalgiana]
MQTKEVIVKVEPSDEWDGGPPPASSSLEGASLSPTLVAHRGFSEEYPENTCLAFAKALEAGATVVECDVQFCKTGEVVIMHDATVDRTTDGTGAVANLTLQELKALDAGVKKGSEFQGERVPLLSEALEIFTSRSDGAKFLIELKFRMFTWSGPAAYKNLAEEVVKIIKAADAQHVVIVHSFIESYLRTIKELAPEIECHLLCFPWRWASTLARIDYVDGYSPNVLAITPTFVNYMHRHGKKVFCWTVNAEEQMRYCIAIGVDGVISDRVATLERVAGDAQQQRDPLLVRRPSRSWKYVLVHMFFIIPISWITNICAIFMT